MSTREQKLEKIVKAVLKARAATSDIVVLDILSNEVEIALRELDELDPIWFITEDEY